MCKDVGTTRKQLEAKGVEFTEPITDEGYGLMTRFRIPGFGQMGLYQPRHASPLKAFS